MSTHDPVPSSPVSPGQAVPARTSPATPALRADGLVKVYAGGVRALDGLCLTIPQGAFFGLLGPNGAGKTTLIGAAAGLVRVPPGHLTVFGRDAVSDAATVRRMLGLAPQEIHLDRFLTTREGLVSHGRAVGMTTRDAGSRADELLAVFDLAEKAEVKPNRLSGGMRRRLLIARALMHRPRLLVLDEPTAGVDLELRHELWRYLRRLHAEDQATILLTTHYIEEAEALCERIAFIRAGRIVAEGSPADLRSRYGTGGLEEVYYTLMGPEGAGAGSTGGQTPISPSLGVRVGVGLVPEPTPVPARTSGEPAACLDSESGDTGHCDPRTIQRRATVALMGREVRRVLTLWSQTIVPPVLTALIYLLVFGGALGGHLREIEGVGYLSFILPGLLVLTVAGQAFGNNATSLFQAKYEGHIEDILSSPMAAWRMALGFMVGGLVRSVIAAAVVVAIAVWFTDGVHGPVLAAVSLGLTSLVFAALGVVTGIWAESFDQFSFVANLVIAPLTLVAGVFYSAKTLGGVWRVLTQVDPVYYLVAATRTGFVGSTEAPVVLSLAVAAGVAGGLFALAAWLLARGWRLKP